MTETGTPYHASVTDFRRKLVEASDKWWETSERHFPQRAEGGAHLDAYAAAMMAGGYAYTLAAILRVASDRYGPDVAHTLACIADDLLMNGEGKPFNDDVKPPKSAGGTANADPDIYDDGTCGDCATGKCHGTEPDDCSCARHDVSIASALVACGCLNGGDHGNRDCPDA